MPKFASPRSTSSRATWQHDLDEAYNAAFILSSLRVEDDEYVMDAGEGTCIVNHELLAAIQKGDAKMLEESYSPERMTFRVFSSNSHTLMLTQEYVNRLRKIPFPAKIVRVKRWLAVSIWPVAAKNFPYIHIERSGRDAEIFISADEKGAEITASDIEKASAMLQAKEEFVFFINVYDDAASPSEIRLSVAYDKI